MPNRYQALIESIFVKHYRRGKKVVPFTREELISTAQQLKIVVPSNLGDVLYSFRYRNPLPQKILDTQPAGEEWQIEIDEVYVGLDKYGCQYIIPIQAKGGNDQLSTVQSKQDMACCTEKFPDLVCRAVSAQFLDDDRIAMFELCLDDRGLVRTVEERHYRLVSADQIGASDLANYRSRA